MLFVRGISLYVARFRPMKLCRKSETSCLPRPAARTSNSVLLACPTRSESSDPLLAGRALWRSIGRQSEWRRTRTWFPCPLAYERGKTLNSLNYNNSVPAYRCKQVERRTVLHRSAVFRVNVIYENPIDYLFWRSRKFHPITCSVDIRRLQSPEVWSP